MPVIAEEHIAVIVGPVRLAAAASVAAQDARHAFTTTTPQIATALERHETIAGISAEGAAAGLRESLRRARENPRPNLGAPDLPDTAREVVAALAETYSALRVARAELDDAQLLRHAEPVNGRLGELAAAVADWANLASIVQRSVGDLPLRDGVVWGPRPDDGRVAGVTALALASSFAMSAALGAMLFIDEHRATGAEDAAAQQMFEIAVQALWAASELAAGVAVCLDHLAHHHHRVHDEELPAAERAIASMRGYRDAIGFQLTELDRYEPLGADETRKGYLKLLRVLEADMDVFELQQR